MLDEAYAITCDNSDRERSVFNPLSVIGQAQDKHKSQRRHPQLLQPVVRVLAAG